MKSKRTYTVTAATGRSGSLVARTLLAQGHQVRAVGRDAARLAPLVQRGAQAFVGNVEDEAFVTRCLEGADAAYLVVTADDRARDFRRAFAAIGETFARAARVAGLPSAVFLSTIGAHDDRYRGFLMTHGDVEAALDQVKGLDVLHLRAPQFFENLNYFVPASAAAGALATPIDPEADLDMVANADVAAVAARRLLALDFQGSSALELHGREVLTMRAIAALASQDLKFELPCVHVDRETDIEAMVAAGMQRDFSTLMNDTWGTFSRWGLLRAGGAQPSERGTTDIRAFLRESFVPALLAARER